MIIGCQPVDDGIKFLDLAPSQQVAVQDFSQLSFNDSQGAVKKVTELLDRQFLVLVITRGFKHSICLYCSSQTSKWARRHGELTSRDASLVVVFPTLDRGDDIQLPMLEQKILGGDVPNDTVPYPILLDLDLHSVDQLGLRAELAKPATYIIDRRGQVRYAYVGRTIADRPSVDAILEQLDRLGSTK